MNRPTAFTWLQCPLCGWQSVEVPDLFRTRLTADYQAHYAKHHRPPPIVRQRREMPA